MNFYEPDNVRAACAAASTSVERKGFVSGAEGRSQTLVNIIVISSQLVDDENGTRGKIPFNRIPAILRLFFYFYAPRGQVRIAHICNKYRDTFGHAGGFHASFLWEFTRAHACTYTHKAWRKWKSDTLVDVCQGTSLLSQSLRGKWMGTKSRAGDTSFCGLWGTSSRGKEKEFGARRVSFLSSARREDSERKRARIVPCESTVRI